MPDCPCLHCGFLRMGAKSYTCFKYHLRVNTDDTGLPVQVALCTSQTEKKEESYD